MDAALRKLLPAARRIDALTAAIGRMAAWLVLAACLLSVFNALMRYGAHFAQPLLLDLPMLLFAFIVLCGAPRALAENSHIRVDILFRALSPRRRALVDILGHLLFLIPLCLVMIIAGLPFFLGSWRIGEGALTPGGLPQWPGKALVPFAFALLLVQALSELVKALAVARGLEISSAPVSGLLHGEDAAASLRSSGAP
ncbi:TRAP-type mannitol/chloroaromatic compound transport system, small permease component [Rhizobiales bacterium GAS191]|nr:TRAP-type mannitol/chloroaromatic compound transport system, small permease component [Rhizobiales bacterium GAS191]